MKYNGNLIYHAVPNLVIGRLWFGWQIYHKPQQWNIFICEKEHTKGGTKENVIL